MPQGSTHRSPVGQALAHDVDRAADVESGRYLVVGRFSALRQDVAILVDDRQRNLGGKLLQQLLRLLHHRAD